MPSDKLSGKSGYFKKAGSPLNITKWGFKGTRKLANTTDSDDYDEDSDLVWGSQVPVSMSGEITVEGNFSKSKTPPAIIAKCFLGGDVEACELAIDKDTPIMTGNADLSDFDITMVVEDTVTYTCTLKTNGVWELAT